MGKNLHLAQELMISSNEENNSVWPSWKIAKTSVNKPKMKFYFLQFLKTFWKNTFSKHCTNLNKSVFLLFQKLL